MKLAYALGKKYPLMKMPVKKSFIWMKVGSRYYCNHDWHARGRVNVIGAIIGATFVTLSVFSCYINSDVFYVWRTQDLLPKISKGEVIVMNNASFHKTEDMLDTINDHGCTLEFLPPYSPDLNPIEKKWAQVKAIRSAKRCSIDDLFATQMDRQFILIRL